VRTLRFLLLPGSPSLKSTIAVLIVTTLFRTCLLSLLIPKARIAAHSPTH
jgi:hypothetical protein